MGYKILGQTSTTVRNPLGGFTDAMKVTFQTDYGVVDSVTVPATQYTAANVGSIIDARVAEIDAVHQLGQ